MSGLNTAGLVEELVRAVSLRCHSHPGEERRSATERADAAKQALLDALSAQAAELVEARAENERLTKERDQARSDYEQEADWSRVVDQSGIDRFDDLADRWLKVGAVQRMHNAAASVFSKWANDELMARFKQHMTNIMHTAYVEGAIAGCRTANAGNALESATRSRDEALAALKVAEEALKPDAREFVAKVVYAAMRWAVERAEAGKPPEWVERGNSLAQSEARRVAHDITDYISAHFVPKSALENSKSRLADANSKNPGTEQREAGNA